MAVLNLGWAASNENRYFPFDDSASLLDNSGNKPPLQALVDMKLMVPETSGAYVYVGALSITPGIVTVVILASGDLDAEGDVIATVSQRLPITTFYPYAIESQVDGVGGWISFGTLDDLIYKGSFSTPRQSLISPLAARSYKVPPVSSVQSLGGSPLTGTVKLIGGNDVEITRECMAIPGHAVPEYHENYCSDSLVNTQSREVIFFKLKNKDEDSSRNVFSIYSGACAKRPQSRNCGAPEPIEFIGPVSPDCDGNITIDLRGCIDMLPIRELVSADEMGDPVYDESSSGITLYCPLQLEDACTKDNYLPDEAGNLPGDYGDLCESVSYITVDEEAPEVPDYSFNVGEAGAAYEAPFEVQMATGNNWAHKFGTFSYSNPCSPSTSCPIMTGGIQSKNIAIYSPATLPTGQYKKVTTTAQLSAGGLGALHNACVIANYSSGSYFVAEIDWDGHQRGQKLFRIARYIGSSSYTIASVPVPELELNGQYSISLRISPGEEVGSAWLTADLVTVSGKDITETLGPEYTSSYGTATGYFGIGTNRAASLFFDFLIESVLS